MSEKFARRVSHLEEKLVLALTIYVKNSLVSLQKGQGAIRLEIKVEGTDDLFLKNDELLASDLLAQERRQSLDHHIEAGIHMLIHLGSHEYADRGQLDQIRGLFALSRKHCEIPISNADCQVKSVLSVVFDTMEFLDE